MSESDLRDRIDLNRRVRTGIIGRVGGWLSNQERTMNASARNQLSIQRFELKQQRRYAETIQVQYQVLEYACRTGQILEISNAYNMLSHLYQLNGQLQEAESAARDALATYTAETCPNLETLATYEMKLSWILAGQRRFAEAVQIGELALAHFSHFHKPPDAFLDGMTNSVALMKRYCDQELPPS
jgi:tetratricopeptide (TPR) repeat protein